MILEFTCDPPDAAEIEALRRADAHSELARWLAGDRRVNNQLRHRKILRNSNCHEKLISLKEPLQERATIEKSEIDNIRRRAPYALLRRI